MESSLLMTAKDAHVTLYGRPTTAVLLTADLDMTFLKTSFTCKM